MLLVKNDRDAYTYVHTTQLEAHIKREENVQEAQLNARGGRPYCPQSYK